MCLKQIRNMRSNNGSKLRGKFWTNELNFKEFTISKKLCIIKKKNNNDCLVNLSVWGYYSHYL